MTGLLLRSQDPSLWQRFLEDPGRLPTDDPVVSRWARVQALGVNPEGREPVVLEASHLAEHRERLACLLDAAYPLLWDAAREFSRRDYTLLLADPEGVIVERFGGGAFEEIARKNRLVEGATWNEAVRGTNAIGTAVAEQASVAVEGCAHWERENHRLSCYASPIHDPQGRLVAVVDATSFSATPAGFAPLAVSTLARGIEAQLRLRAYEACGGLSTMQRALRHVTQPAFLIERGAAVRVANEAGRAWLGGLLRRELMLKDVFAAAAAGRPRLFVAEREVTLEPLVGDDGLVFATLAFVGPTRRASFGLTRDPFVRLAGDDPHLQDAKTRAAKFAQTNLPVLLLAETGTGKELMARAIHAASPRHAGPFVALNCGALSEALLESELFGYGPGAFTGARPEGASGKLEAAAGGTLFLDEVAEMPARLQALLLRVLEDGTFHRVGDVETRKADFRLVAATCRDLPGMVTQGVFRQDLYFRVRGACLGLPPLRERRDRLLLARAILADLAPDGPPELDDSAVAYIEGHDWPGNVRELKTALAHAYALDPDRITVENLPDLELGAPHEPTRPRRPSSVGRGGPTSDVPSRRESEVEALDLALEASQGNLSDAARRLGVARSTLYRMMRRHGRLR
ncbi:MAG: sigma-54-dependent Fis family transcriptional regulator [Deltaproteobacteria bacterium]|nr:sigma-54-dependent Fis family transcriptional regulator [Deltaproteobacteria bacterium]